jgi:hypothetical protein
MHNFLGSKKQQSIVLSSTNFEYMVVTKVTFEVIWLRKLLAKLGFPQKDLTIIYLDSQNSITFSEDTKYHSRSKHVDTQYQCFIKEKIFDKKIQYNTFQLQP